MYKKILPALVLVTVISSAYSQAVERKFTIEQLRHDFTIFSGSLKEAHAGLYRYTPSHTIDSLLNVAYASIDHDMTELEFYQTMMPVIVAIRCGHTKWYRADHPDDPFAFVQENLFPLKMLFKGDKAFVLNSYTGEKGIEGGAELVSVNGRPMSKIIDQLRNFITVDAFARSTYDYELNRLFNGYYSTFIESKPEYQLVLRTSRGAVSKTVKGIRADDILLAESTAKVDRGLPLRLTYPSADVALLVIESFYADSKIQDYYKFVDSAFLVLKEKNIKNLILDIRGNEGGEEDRGGYLYSYLTDKVFTFYKKIPVVITKDFTYKQYAYLPSQIAHMDKFTQRRDGEVLFTYQKYSQPQPRQANAFTGEIFILINGGSFSVTSEFASVVYENKLATFIGEETAGGYFGDNSGVFAIVSLPNTKLTLGIPLLAFYSNVRPSSAANRGVMPHYPISPGAADVLERRDPVLDYTLKLIKTGKTRKAKR